MFVAVHIQFFFFFIWLKEAESRMVARRAGQLGAIDADEVFAELAGVLEAVVAKTRVQR